MNARLVVRGGKKGRQIFPFQPPELVVGRGEDCAVRIPSADVSRRHCRVCLLGRDLAIEDLGSVNGTFLNGEVVTGVALLQPGDEVGVGPVTFVVQYERAAKGERGGKPKKGGRKGEPKPSPEPEPVAPLPEDDEPELLPLDSGPSQPPPEPVDLDANGTWHAPDPNSLRDLLLGLDAGEEADDSRHER